MDGIIHTIACLKLTVREERRMRIGMVMVRYGDEDRYEDLW